MNTYLLAESNGYEGNLIKGTKNSRYMYIKGTTLLFTVHARYKGHEQFI